MTRARWMFAPVISVLLGTKEKKLWRTSEDMAPFGLPGFLWANNNNRDPAVFCDDEVVAKGYHPAEELVFDLDR